jgi:hypothetical protein
LRVRAARFGFTRARNGITIIGAGVADHAGVCQSAVSKSLHERICWRHGGREF